MKKDRNKSYPLLLMLMLNQHLRTMIIIVFLSSLLWVFLGFPIVPLENMEGTYEGHEYFVYERISKPLNEIVRSNSMNVTKDDLVNVAIQILGILRHLFAKKKILKNLHEGISSCSDESRLLRKVSLSMWIYCSQSFDIDDTTFTSVSVMHGNCEDSSNSFIDSTNHKWQHHLCSVHHTVFD